MGLYIYLWQQIRNKYEVVNERRLKRKGIPHPMLVRQAVLETLDGLVDLNYKPQVCIRDGRGGAGSGCDQLLSDILTKMVFIPQKI